MTKVIGRFSISLLICFSVTACTFLPSRVNDIRVERVEFVGLESKRDLPVLSRFLKGADVALRVTLSSSVDIGNLAERKHLNVAFDAAACAAEEEKKLEKWPYIYLENVQVGYIGIPPLERDEYRTIANRISPPERYQYDAYIRGDTKSSKYASFYYDLRSQPFDICVRLAGGNMTGGTLVSNTAVISRQSLVEAVRHQQQK